jgi:hypothetical protein
MGRLAGDSGAGMQPFLPIRVAEANKFFFLKIHKKLTKYKKLLRVRNCFLKILWHVRRDY